MAMGICQKCLENNWSFKVCDGIVTASCNICGNEVTFEAKKKTNIRETGVCRRCGNNKLILKLVKKPKTFKNYLFCEKCKAMYFLDKI